MSEPRPERTGTTEALSDVEVAAWSQQPRNLLAWEMQRLMATIEADRKRIKELVSLLDRMTVGGYSYQPTAGDLREAAKLLEHRG